MTIEPVVLEVEPKRLVGVRARMSMAEDATSRIWRALMSRRHEIANRVDDRRVSVCVYLEPDLTPDKMFRPTTELDKWAAVEVTEAGVVPEGMETHVLQGGLYAVFAHRGGPRRFPEVLRYFYGTWLPGSGYRLDDREHYEVLPAGWTPTDPDAEEEVFVPVRR
jgi:AraC family transcriptional regulator